MGQGADAGPAAVKDLLIALGVITLCLGVLGVVVFALGDENTFVSPPEIVAEEFVRALGDGRAGPARRMLAESAERVTSFENLRRVSDSVRRRYGTIDDVDGNVADRRGNEVVVRVAVKGSRAREEVRLPTVRERGEWKIAGPFGLLPSAEAAGPR